MKQFAFTLCFALIISILQIGCTAPIASTPEPTQVDTWKGTHISKVIKEWGPPDAVNDHETGGRIYVWQMSAQDFLTRRPPFIEREDPNPMARHARSSTFPNYSYHFTFYTQPNGVIYKTLFRDSLEKGLRSRKRQEF